MLGFWFPNEGTRKRCDAVQLTRGRRPGRSARGLENTVLGGWNAAPVVASLVLEARPGAPSSFLFLLVRPGAPSSICVGHCDTFGARKL